MICTCRCHTTPDEQRAFAASGVDVRNVIEAAVACRSCQNAHAPALRNTALPNDTPVVVPRGVVHVITPEGRTMTWSDYAAEMEKRADAWRHSDPEGPQPC